MNYLGRGEVDKMRDRNLVAALSEMSSADLLDSPYENVPEYRAEVLRRLMKEERQLDRLLGEKEKEISVLPPNERDERIHRIHGKYSQSIATSMGQIERYRMFLDGKEVERGARER